jgi:octaprenyl-diphosphate synthase
MFAIASSKKSVNKQNVCSCPQISPSGFMNKEVMEQAYLDRVESCLEGALVIHAKALGQASTILSQASRYLCFGNSSKRARPLLSLYFGQAVAQDSGNLVAIGAAAELIHSASLLHDDVVDVATMRRGRPSVNVHFSNAVAVLAGDFLLSRAFFLLKEYPERVRTEAIEVVEEMTTAALTELAVRAQLDVSLETLRDVAVGKTGALFAWCGQAAALSAGREEAAKCFWRAGRHIGAAFQLADDLKDFVDLEGLKDRFSDLKNREPSYPILVAAQSSETAANAIAALWQEEEPSPEHIAEIGNKVLATGAIEITREAMRKEVAAAMDTMGSFIATPGGECLKDWLRRLSTF